MSSDLPEAGKWAGEYQLNIEKVQIRESFPLFKAHLQIHINSLSLEMLPA